MNSLSPIQEINAIALNDQAQQFLDVVFAVDTNYNFDPIKLTVSPLTPSGVSFLWSYLEDANEDSYKDFSIQPTAAMYRAGAMVVCWALDVCESSEDVKDVADALGMEPPEFPVPVPSDDWKLIHCDQNFTSLGDFRAKMPVEVETSTNVGPVAEVGLGTYGDAKIMRSYNEADYSQEIVITAGAAKASKNWKPVKQPLGKFLASLCRHKEGTKDGPAFVLGDMVPGQRLKVAVKALYAIGLDIDTGTQSSVVDQALLKIGVTAVRYTTHSNNKTKTEFKKDKITKFANGAEIDDALIQRYLREDQHWDESIVKTATIEGDDHDDRGIIVLIKHAPIPKHRIVVPLEHPFEIGKEADTQKEAMEKWAKVPAALAAELNLPFDKSCVDPSRLFYFPRHAKGKSFEISLFGGPLFDFTKLVLDDPMDDLVKIAGKGSSKSVTQEGRDLGRWSIKRGAGFQIVDVIEAYAPDRIRGAASSNGKTIDCPFDDDHSNMGDRNDTGCFVVNAGYGPSEVFTASCRHESCRDKTNLDMLGKMLKDAWFDKAVLEDENFNAIVVDTPEKPKSEAKKKIEKEDKAKAEYQEKIDELTNPPDPLKVNEMAAVVVAAALSTSEFENAVTEIIKKTGYKKTAVRLILKEAQARALRRKKHPIKDDSGRVIYSFTSEPDVFELTEICLWTLYRQALQQTNVVGAPIFSHFYGDLVRFDPQSLSYEDIGKEKLWSELNNHVAVVRRTEQGDGPRQFVDRDVAAQIYSQASKNFGAAPEIRKVPHYSRNGALVVSPGYHDSPKDGVHVLLIDTGLKIPEVPSEPTLEQMQASLAWIRNEILADFPLLDTDNDGKERREPAEANALAMLLTPSMRLMIDGPVPVLFVTKPVPGTGGSLLGSLPLKLSEGFSEQDGAVNYTNDDTELLKVLVAKIKLGGMFLFFDDVREFCSQHIIRWTTSRFLEGRELGSSTIIKRPNTHIFIATGNNPKISVDMRRRIVWIRLDAKLPAAKIKTRNFKHKNFDAWLAENRGLAIHHILTLIEYWRVTKKAEPYNGQVLPTFEDWCHKVGGVLQACGVEGFLNTREPIVADPEDNARTEFVSLFRNHFGVGSPENVADIFAWVKSIDVLTDMLEGHNDNEKRSNFSRTLSRLDGFTFEAEGKSYRFRAKTGTTFEIEMVA